MRLGHFTVLSFDCYGTLIDWESGIFWALRSLVARAGGGRSPEEVLAAFARHESAQHAETPGMLYSALLARVHRRLVAEWGVASDAAEDNAFAASIGNWSAFADTAPAPAYLQRFYKLVILSNVNRARFVRSRHRLGADFAAIYTAEEIGSYNADLNNFHRMIGGLAAEGHQLSNILHVAQSLYHDHAPANRCGLRSAWIDRRAGDSGRDATPPPVAAVTYDFRFLSLAELVAAHEAEQRCRGDRS